jgi:hypothetical protein
MNDTTINVYPVPGRSELRNRRIAGHEIGHAFVGRCLGNNVHSVSIVRGPHFEGRVIRSGPASELVFAEKPDDETDEIVDVCDRLARMQPELGSGRVVDSEMVVRGQSAMIELVAGRVAEEILHADYELLGAKHDDVEAAAFGRVCVAAQPAVAALISYCEAEARALLLENITIVRVLVEELIAVGSLTGEQVDEIISATVARQLADIERRRRTEWRRCEHSAAEFLKAIELGNEPGRPGVTA